MKLKQDKTEHSAKVRKRALFAMYRIIEKKIDVRSASKFAERIHTTGTAIVRWENGTGWPTTENLVDICIEFSIAPDWLFLGKGNMHGDAEVIVRLNNLEGRVKYLEKKAGILPKDYKKKGENED